MSIPKETKASLSLDDNRFKLVLVHEAFAAEEGKYKKVKNVRYPKVQVLKNRIRVGCITVSREAALKLLEYEPGFVQGESAK